MPGLYKIGYSLKDPTLRAKELDRTGSPTEYRVAFRAYLENPDRVEKIIHKKLAQYRVRGDREWFKASEEYLKNQVIEIIKSCGGAYFSLEGESERQLGYIYLLSNPSMPNLVKIGYTYINPELRAKELDETGVPQSFKVEFYIISFMTKELEKKIHAHLSDYRVRNNREWFACTVDEAMYNIISLGLAYDPKYHYLSSSAKGVAISEKFISCLTNYKNLVDSEIESEKKYLLARIESYRQEKILEINSRNEKIFNKKNNDEEREMELKITKHKNAQALPIESRIIYSIIGISIGLFINPGAALFGGILGAFFGFYEDSATGERALAQDKEFLELKSAYDLIAERKYKPQNNLTIEVPDHLIKRDFSKDELSAKINSLIKKWNIIGREFFSDSFTYPGINKILASAPFVPPSVEGKIYQQNGGKSHELNKLFFDPGSGVIVTFQKFSSLNEIDTRFARSISSRTWVLIPSQRKLIDTSAGVIYVNNSNESLFSLVKVNEKIIGVGRDIYTYEDFLSDLEYRNSIRKNV